VYTIVPYEKYKSLLQRAAEAAATSTNAHRPTGFASTKIPVRDLATGITPTMEKAFLSPAAAAGTKLNKKRGISPSPIGEEEEVAAGASIAYKRTKSVAEDVEDAKKKTFEEPESWG
jgi:hypothetical protein